MTANPEATRLADRLLAMVPACADPRDYTKDDQILLDATARPKAASVPGRERRDAIVHAIASLAAAISLLQRTPKAKKAAPYDCMFEQMLRDYRKALGEARTALAEPTSGEALGLAKLHVPIKLS